MTGETSESTQVAGRVLLVDDDQDVLKSYGRVLEMAGFLVVRLSNGTQVNQALSLGAFDAVISDIAMPGMDGTEVLRAVRERDPDLPVILMTGAADVQTATKAVELSALRYLIKPVDLEQLLESTRHAVRLRQLARVQRRAFELFGRAATESEERRGLEVRLDNALASVRMAYQPIVSWSRRTVHAYEALLRTGDRTIDGPAEILATAEKLDRLVSVGRTVRRHVGSTVAASPGGPCVFINLHPRDLLDDDLYAPSAPLSLVASRIVLEITERASLDGMDDLPTRLAQLRTLGFRVALDDLGAGYAGLNAFARLEPDVVKLDMSLARGVDLDRTKQKLIRSMVGLSRELGILVIAEGIETAQERDTVAALGCDLMQGYLFARPGPPFPPVDW